MAMDQDKLGVYLAHVGQCLHCQCNPFSLCKTGMRLLVDTSPAVMDHTQKNGATWPIPDSPSR